MVCLWTHPTTLITWGSSCLTQHNNGVVQWCVPLPKRNHFNMVSSVFRWLLALCTCNDLKAEVWNLNQEILTFDVDWNVATVLVRVAVNHLHTVSLLSPNWSPRSETLCPVPVRWLGGGWGPLPVVTCPLIWGCQISPYHISRSIKEIWMMVLYKDTKSSHWWSRLLMYVVLRHL